MWLIKGAKFVESARLRATLSLVYVNVRTQAEN